MKKGELIVPVEQRGGNYERIIINSTNIGIDVTTGKQTKIYTIITSKNGDLITGFPGKP